MHIIPELGPSIALALPFFVAFMGLYVILWRPLMAFLDEREQATDGARHEAEELAAQADERAEALEVKLVEARREVMELHNAARTRAVAKEAEIIGAARSEAETRIADAQKRIDSERQSARAELETAAKTLSTDIVDTLLA